MQLNLSSLASVRVATSASADDEEAEHMRHLIVSMTEAKRMLSSLLADLAQLETSMADPEPDDLTH